MPEPADAAQRSVLFTDLYELTMVQAYLAEGLEDTAVFEIFFRSLPEQRNFAIAAGLEDVLSALESLEIRSEEIAYLRSLSLFSDSLLDWLKSFRFTGDIYAVPEGTIVFPNEPIIQVVAPITQAQLIETIVLNQVHLQTVAASKAARLVIAAQGREIVDFGSRRAHGTDAALKVARCSWLAGAAGTSNVLAGYRYGIPVLGTMAHSYIQAHDDELDAFAAFTREFPKTTLLVDTYDSVAGVRHVIDLARRLGENFKVRAIRLDSGDLGPLARHSRQILDEAGLHDVKVFASGGLDEFLIAELVSSGAPIDGFGVGSDLAVSRDAPDFDMAYKLVEYAGRPRLKLSTGKALLPGRKQVFRKFRSGVAEFDVLGTATEEVDGEPLLQLVMRNGKRTPAGSITLDDARRLCSRQLAQLPERLRQLTPASDPYAVEISPGLKEQMDAARSSLHDDSTR